MSDNLRQRRGNKSHSTAPQESTLKEKALEGTEDKESGIQLAPIEQLQSAHARLILSRDRTADLHTAWRNQLFRLSLLVVILCIHQFQTPVSSCIKEIQNFNKSAANAGNNASGLLIDGSKAFRIVVGDSFVELLGIVTSSLLAYYLAVSRNIPLELDKLPYVISSALVPLQLGIYFHSTHLGCLGEKTIYESQDSNSPVHQFPVVVIFHTIVTVACWFMKSGMKQCEEHVTLVKESIEDFERMEKKMKLKKQKIGVKKR